tara:strand:+ start:781 stop:1179 length:399 start_codon:yes stop_codon:yes gene_type:complete
MKTVEQMITLVKEVSGLSKDKEVEELMGIKPMGMASLKRDNRVGSFLKFLVPFCQQKEISIDEFLLEKRTNRNFSKGISQSKQEEEETMYREKFEEAQSRIIELLEEVNVLNQKLSIDSGPSKKVGTGRKVG